MFVTVRSALMVIATLTASSVAPAQVNVGSNPDSEPLMVQSSVPTTMDVTPLPAVPADESADPLAPIAEAKPEAEELEAGATLAETVANLRGSEAGSRELECLAV